jgi:hypothetical protein
MALGEAESALVGLFPKEAANVFNPVGPVFKCFGTSCIQGGRGMLPDQPAQRHDGAQRLGATRFQSRLRPLAALLTEYRCSADPITAGGQNRVLMPPAPKGWLNLPGSSRV